MTQETLINDLKEINQAVSRELWSMGTHKRHPSRLTGRLIFPEYSKGQQRVSEQEARFVYARVIENRDDFFYSVETPTERQYSFSSEGERSAMSDLSLYDVSSLKKAANVEFKAHNPDESSIHKDIVKLLKEALPGRRQGEATATGNWYHLLENADSGTFDVLFEKLKSAISEEKDIMTRNIGEVKRLDTVCLTILFTFCVLHKERRFALERSFEHCPTESGSFENSWNQFWEGLVCKPAEKRKELIVSGPKARKWIIYDENGVVVQQER